MEKKDNFLFLDTSIFVQENFLEGARINTILNLSERGYFRLMFSEITINEVKAQFKKQVRLAIIKHNELINDKKNDVRVLRNNDKGRSIIQKLPTEKIICREFNELFNRKLTDAKATILAYPTMNVGKIFEDYFNNRSPFGHGDKKQEFPDAFVISHIEQWCGENDVVATILSKDKDFLSRESDDYFVIYDYEKFIEDKVREIEVQRTDRLNELYIAKSAKIDEEIIKCIDEQFDNETVFENFTNWMDLHGITVLDLHVVSKSYEITGDDGENLEIEITAIIAYKLSLEIDDSDSGIYDREDDVVLFRDTTEISLEQSDLEVTITINFNIVEPDDYDEEFEILEFNNSKDIDLDPDGWDDL